MFYTEWTQGRHFRRGRHHYHIYLTYTHVILTNVGIVVRANNSWINRSRRWMSSRILHAICVSIRNISFVQVDALSSLNDDKMQRGDLLMLIAIHHKHVGRIGQL